MESRCRRLFFWCYLLADLLFMYERVRTAPTRAQRKTRGCRTAHRYPPELVVVPGAAGSSSRARPPVLCVASRRRAKRKPRLGRSTFTGTDNVTPALPRLASRQPRRKSNLPSVSSSSSFYLEYVISRTGGVEEATAASRSRDCSSPSYYFRSLSLPSRLKIASLAANSFFFRHVSCDARFYLRDSRLPLWSMVI